MKTNILVFFLILVNINLLAQENEVSSDSVRLLQDKGYKLEINNKVVKIGMSLGFSGIPYKMYDATISPIDNTLRLDERFPASFLISTCIVINPIRRYEKHNNFILRRLHKVSFIATINLVQLGASSSTVFNNKIDGGLGIGYKLSDDFHISFSAEMFSVRQLRNFIIDNYENKPIEIGGQELTNLDVNDNKLFIDKYVPGFCVKFIYIIANKDNE